MNDINVLYKNTRFNTDEKNSSEIYEFASDLTLTNLLKRVNIPKKPLPKKLQKNASPPDAANGYFKRHPRNVGEDSMFSIDNYYDDNLIDRRTENSILNQFNNSKHETAEERHEHYARVLAICKNFLDKDVISDEKQNLPINENNIGKTTETVEFKKNIKRPPPSAVPDDIMGVNIKAILIKIEAWIQETRSAISTDIVPIEGVEDMTRREKRAIGFSSRFSRNYLYQLSRQLKEMRKYVSRSYSSQKSRPGVPPPSRVITNSCQIVLQAMQAYCNIVPTAAVSSPVHEKFLELIRSTLELCRILRRLATNYHDIKSAITSVEDIETNVRLLENEVKQHILSKSKPVPKPETKSVKQSMLQRKKSQVSNHLDIPFHKKQPLEKRLSMYCLPFKRGNNNANWKKSTTKSRFNVQSRYKEAAAAVATAAVTNKHEKHQNGVVLPRKLIVTERKLSVASSIDQPICNNDEDISTMVQVTDKKAGKTVDQIISTRLEPVLQDIVKEEAANKQEEQLGHTACDGVLDKLRGIPHQVQHCTKGGDDCIKQHGNKNDRRNGFKLDSMRITGTKNAKLICIKDKSCFEPDSIENIDNNKNIVTKPSLHHKQDLNNQENKDDKDIIRNKKPSVHVCTKLSRKFATNIIQYKLQYHKFSKSNFMYKKSSKIQPWILVSKVSDDLLDNLLSSILKELDVSKLIESVFKGEFE